MPLFVKDFFIKVAIHAGIIFLSKFTLHITIATCAGYYPASPSNLISIMNTVKPSLRNGRTSQTTGFISIRPVATYFIFPTVKSSFHIPSNPQGENPSNNKVLTIKKITAK
jgi:hypothetical protein